MKKFLVLINAFVIFSCSHLNHENEKQILSGIYSSKEEKSEQNNLSNLHVSTSSIDKSSLYNNTIDGVKGSGSYSVKKAGFSSLSYLAKLFMGASLITSSNSESLVWSSGGNSLYDITGQYQLNNCEDFSQAEPAVTYLSNRDFVPVWQNASKGRGVYGQRFNRLGETQGSRIMVNNNTKGYKGSPDVASLSSGEFVSVWESFDQEGGVIPRYGVYMQFFNKYGYKVGNETLVNNYTIDDQTHPKVKKLSGEYVIVTWQSDDQEPLDGSGDPGGEGIFVRAIEMVNRTFVNIDYQVNTKISGDQETPAITALADNQFVVAYSTDSQVDKDIAFQRMSLSSGTHVFSKLGSETTVNTITAGLQGRPDIDTLTTGEFVITWQSTFNNLLPSIFVIKARKYNVTGGPISGETLVSLSTSTYTRNCPVVAKLPNGKFVISWAEKNVTGTQPYKVMAQVFDNDLSTIGPIFQVNSYPTETDYFCPAIASEDSGFEFVIVWESSNPVPYKNNLNVFGNNYRLDDGSPTPLPTPAPTDEPTSPTLSPTPSPTDSPVSPDDDDEFSELELILIIGGSIVAAFAIVFFAGCIYFYCKNKNG